MWPAVDDGKLAEVLVKDDKHAAVLECVPQDLVVAGVLRPVDRGLDIMPTADQD